MENPRPEKVAVVDEVKSRLNDAEAAVLTDYRGISGVALSVPTVVDGTGIRQVIDVPFSVEEMGLLERSAETLATSLRSLGF